MCPGTESQQDRDLIRGFCWRVEISLYSLSRPNMTHTVLNYSGDQDGKIKTIVFGMLSGRLRFARKTVTMILNLDSASCCPYRNGWVKHRENSS